MIAFRAVKSTGPGATLCAEGIGPDSRHFELPTVEVRKEKKDGA